MHLCVSWNYVVPRKQGKTEPKDKSHVLCGPPSPATLEDVPYGRTTKCIVSSTEPAPAAQSKFITGGRSSLTNFSTFLPLRLCSSLFLFFILCSKPWPCFLVWADSRRITDFFYLVLGHCSGIDLSTWSALGHDLVSRDSPFLCQFSLHDSPPSPNRILNIKTKFQLRLILFFL